MYSMLTFTLHKRYSIIIYCVLAVCEVFKTKQKSVNKNTYREREREREIKTAVHQSLDDQIIMNS